MNVVSFFSYKGGVGRSLAVSHVAEQLAKHGLSSFVIDFDLEAPGMLYKFTKDLDKIKDKQPIKKGIVDYIHSFFVENNKEKLPANLEDYYYTLPVEDKRKAQIWLMPAGNLQNGYWDKLADIDWKRDFLLEENKRLGSHLLLDLKERIKKELNPDYILIDSRTGISDITTLTLRLMADKVVVIAVNNPENLDGSETILRTMQAQDNWWNNKPKELLFALSRFPKPGDDKEIEREKNITAEVKQRFVPALVADDNFTILHDDRELAWGEKNISSTLDTEHLTLKEDYGNLFKIVTRDNPLVREVDRQKISEKEESDLLLTKASSLFVKGEYNEGLSVINQITEHSRGFLFYHIRAIIFGELEMFESAIKDCEKADAIKPGDAIGYYNWGWYLGELADIEKNEDLYVLSCSKYQKATSINPNDAASYYNWATMLGKLASSKAYNADVYEEIFEKCKKAIEINPTYALAYNNWGFYLSNMASRTGEDLNLYKRAIEMYDKAIEIDPGFSDPYANRANVMGFIAQSSVDKNLYQDAFKSYQKAIAIKPTVIRYRNWAFDLIGYSKFNDEKRTIYSQALEKFLEAEKIEFGSCLYDIACIYSLLDDKENALKYLDQTLKLNKISLEHIAQDSDMDNLRNLPEFKALIAKYSSDNTN